MPAELPPINLDDPNQNPPEPKPRFEPPEIVLDAPPAKRIQAPDSPESRREGRWVNPPALPPAPARMPPVGPSIAMESTPRASADEPPELVFPPPKRRRTHWERGWKPSEPEQREDWNLPPANVGRGMVANLPSGGGNAGSPDSSQAIVAALAEQTKVLQDILKSMQALEAKLPSPATFGA